MKKSTNITSTFAKKVIQEAHNGCINLAPGAIREAKKLCDPLFWLGLRTAEQIQAGKVIAEAVKQGLLPLKYYDLSGSFHLRYERL